MLRLPQLQSSNALLSLQCDYCFSHSDLSHFRINSMLMFITHSHRNYSVDCINKTCILLHDAFIAITSYERGARFSHKCDTPILADIVNCYSTDVHKLTHQRTFNGENVVWRMALLSVQSSDMDRIFWMHHQSIDGGLIFTGASYSQCVFILVDWAQVIDFEELT